MASLSLTRPRHHVLADGDLEEAAMEDSFMHVGLKCSERLSMGRKEMRPILLKVGVALFLSFAGFLYTHLRSRGGDRRRGRPPSRSASGGGVAAAGEACGGCREEFLHSRCEEELLSARNGSCGEGAASSPVGLSPGVRNLGDEGYLLPEFNELVLQEFKSVGFDMDVLKASPTDRFLQGKDEEVSDQEIGGLKNLVHLLQERVACLEIQLLEYYGIKEQESTVRELENHLKINTVEAKILALKIESLQAENQRLGAQVSDYSRIKAELESAQSKIKHLERKLRSDSVQANEKVTELHHNISALQDGEDRGEDDNEEVERKLKHLEDEAAELRRAKSKLAMEKLDLEKKLSTEFLASSGQGPTEATKLLEEANRLRQTNDELTKEIAQLQIDRCAEIEELVYLRWVNACLRYELRNYQPPPGKTAARDLSKTLSPKSEQKVKQLILEYANSGTNDKSINLMDFDSECCSSSQASSLTDNGEVDDSLVDVSITTKSSSSSKSKFLGKLKRLVLGKDIQHKKVSSVDRSPTSCGTLERRASVSACSFDDIMDRNSYDSAASCITLDNAAGNQFMAVERKLQEQQLNEGPWTRNLSRVSVDFQKLRRHGESGVMKGERSKSDVGASYWHTVGMGEESLLQSPLDLRIDHEILDLPKKSKVNKDAYASKSPCEKPKLRRKSASISS